MSTPRRRIVVRPNRQPDESAWIQKPRNVTHSHLFWLLMSVPFNSVANEVQTALTEPEGFDCIVRSGWTDLQGAQVRMKETESDRAWASSSDYIGVRSILGNSSEVHPLLPFPQPTFLETRAQLQGDWLNVGSEAAGTAAFHSIKAGLDPAGRPYDGIVRVTKSISYWLKLDLSTVNPSTNPVNSDVLIWGATTNIETSATLIQIFNESTNYAWSSQQIPILAFAGQDGQPQPIMRYSMPYLLPNYVKLRAATSAAVTGGFINFYCERILA